MKFKILSRKLTGHRIKCNTSVVFPPFKNCFLFYKYRKNKWTHQNQAVAQHQLFYLCISLARSEATGQSSSWDRPGIWATVFLVSEHECVTAAGLRRCLMTSLSRSHTYCREIKAMQPLVQPSPCDAGCKCHVCVFSSGFGCHQGWFCRRPDPQILLPKLVSVSWPPTT